VSWAAAALVLVAVVGYLTRSRHADAAELLQAVKAAWTTVPALHQVVRMTGPGGSRTEETWVIRHSGLRQETRSGGDLVGVVVRGARWEFRWDIPGRTVAAWSTELASARRRPEDEGLVLDRNDFEAWARSHRAELAVERDMVAGREARRVVLRWPGVGGPQTTTVWFDSGSLLPLKQHFQSPDGTAVETTIDYPSADAVPGDLFRFTIPRDIVLEVNDPELGRQLYSESQARKAPRPGSAVGPAPAAHTQGAKR
jgi:hypothetical protein